ncbi:MAG: PIN domain-containing protein [Caldilineaceae bacterium]|jgi:predicted nucleic acid-binding protein
MNVYVETNFVLELVFEQEQYQWCENLLSLCEVKKISLLLPAYCLMEPHEKLARQSNTRLELQRILVAEVRQLSRTASYTARVTQMQDIGNLLLQSNRDEQQRFYHYLNRILGVTEIIPLTAEVISDGVRNEGLYKLRPQDAIVYASVINHLRQHNTVQSCFLNRNSRDFDVPNILQELNQYNCRMIPLFDQGYQFINTRVT